MSVRPLFGAALLALACLAASAADVLVLCAGAVKPVLAELGPAWQSRSGHRLLAAYAPAGELRERLAAGEVADLVILPAEGLAAAEQAGWVAAGARRDLGAVGIGVAVGAHAPLPDVSSEDGLKRALLAARSVIYMDPARGTSGRHFDEVVLPRLAIRDQVRAKAVLGQGGMIAEQVASGEVEIAIQQMTELLPVAGIRIAGPLPPSLQKTTVYAGAVLNRAAAPAAAAELQEFLRSGPAQAVFAAKGFAAP